MMKPNKKFILGKENSKFGTIEMSFENLSKFQPIIEKLSKLYCLYE